MKRAKKASATTKIKRAKAQLRKAAHLKRKATAVLRTAKKRHESPAEVLLRRTTRRRKKKGIRR